MAEQDVAIVTPGEDEWAAFRDLRLRALTDSPQAFGGSYAVAAACPEAEWRRRLREAAEGHNWLVCARHDGRLVGMIGAFQSDEDRGERRATVVGAFVEPELRGRGIGQMLLAALLKQLAARGGMAVARLTVNREQTAAVRLYEAAGFRVVKEGVIVLGDGLPHPELVMERPLR